MKKSNITGWKDVFAFTLIQTLKSKAFIISYVIFLVMSLVSMPIITMITRGGEKDDMGPSPVKKVYVNNETTLPHMNFKEVLKDSRFSHISFDVMKEDYDAISQRIEGKEKDSIILTIAEDKGNYSLSFVKASDGPVKNSSMTLLSDSISHEFETFKMNALGVDEKQLSIIHAEVNSKVSMADIDGVEIIKEDTSISNSEYWFIYGILFVIMMVNIMASTQIASSIVTEKSTRIVEYLLTSVKPLAIMVGKIIGMLTAVLFQVVSILIILGISNIIAKGLSFSNGESLLSQYLPRDIFQNLNLGNILLCLVLIILGMIFYAVLAGLAGATVSRIEEMNEGLTLFTITNLIGVYIGLAASTMLMSKGINGFVIFSFLFPLSSPFLLPGAILIGKVSYPMVAAALILQVVFIVLLFGFVAKVYEALILHNGNKVKLKDLIKLSKTL